MPPQEAKRGFFPPRNVAVGEDGGSLRPQELLPQNRLLARGQACKNIPGRAVRDEDASYQCVKIQNLLLFDQNLRAVVGRVKKIQQWSRLLAAAL